MLKSLQKMTGIVVNLEVDVANQLWQSFKLCQSF